MSKSNKSVTRALVSSGLLAAATLAGAHVHADTLNGAGGTAIYPVLSDWAQAYQQDTGTSVNYQAIGSGGGIRQIEHKTVTFANSDMPLAPGKLDKQGLVQFPAVIIGITPVVNLPGVKPGQMVFSGKEIADIYLGKIHYWDNSEVKALNPGLKLPHMAITVVHRSDGSGTTFNFTNYLSKVSPAWKDKVGASTAVNWPTGVGGKGNAGVAAYVRRIKGSIGYVEYAYTMKTHMTYGKMKNADGHVVAPNMRSFQAAAANADFSKTRDFYLILTDQPGARSWPITAATYILMRKDTPRSRNEKVLHFTNWFLEHGQSFARKLDYVPLPGHTIALIHHYWKQQLGI